MHGIATGRQAVQSSPPDIAVAAASLGLLCRVMEWDFRHTQLPSAVAARRIFDPSEVRTTVVALVRAGAGGSCNTGVQHRTSPDVTAAQ